MTPDPAGSGVFPDWVGHLGVFGAVGAAFGLLRVASRWPASRLAWLGLAVIVLGAATEAGQSFTGRQPELSDFLFDVAGGLAGLAGVEAALFRARVLPGGD